MSLLSIVRKILPADMVASLARVRKRLIKARLARLPLISETKFSEILSERLGLRSGDTVYVHSSVDQLNLDFPFYRILPLIREVLGPEGTVLFPTYPNRSPLTSHEYLANGNVFNIKRSPAYTGLLNEFARRQRGSVRSLHPTKSVCAIGPNAREMTATHQDSPYPYDICSPYYKLIDYDAKIIGLGVWTQYLSFVYCIDDALKTEAPVHTYLPEIFKGQCINDNGETVVVETYAHDMRRVIHDIPAFVRKHIPPEVCQDLLIDGMRFFRADARKLFEMMLPLAKRGITVYPRSVYADRTSVR